MYSFKYKYLAKNMIEREGILIKNHELPWKWTLSGAKMRRM